jgi:uncharacterized membrane protein YedE/YeeE
VNRNADLRQDEEDFHDAHGSYQFVDGDIELLRIYGTGIEGPMLNLLDIPLPWYVVGPGMGLTVAGLYAVTNCHLGVSGAYVQAVDWARGRPVEGWRLWFLAGTVLGAALVALLGGSPQFGLGYGRLGELLSLPLLVGVLFIGGVLIGFGARWAGACTSGHGLTGCSTRSPGSVVAVAIFMITAVALTLLMRVLTGGRL